MEFVTVKPRGLPKIIGILFIADILLILLYLGNHFIDYPFDWFTEFVDLDNENNLPAWYSAIQLFFLSICLGVFAFDISDNPGWKVKLIWLMPLLFLFMSLDEIAMIHETLGEITDYLLAGGSRRNTPFRVTGIWMFLFGIPFFILMSGAILMLKGKISNINGVVSKYFIGLIVFVVSAAGTEIFSNFYRRGPGYLAQVCLEELGEMLGITILLWATLELLHSQGIYFNNIFSKRQS